VCTRRAHHIFFGLKAGFSYKQAWKTKKKVPPKMHTAPAAGHRFLSPLLSCQTHTRGWTELNICFEQVFRLPVKATRPGLPIPESGTVACFLGAAATGHGGGSATDFHRLPWPLKIISAAKLDI